MLKEQVAQIILHADIYRRPIPVTCVETPTQQILNLFKSEVDKLTVLVDEDIKLLLQKFAFDVVPENMTFAGYLTEAQLQHTKKQLLDLMRGVS